MKNPSELNKVKYDKYRNKLTKLIRIAKSSYYTKLFEGEKPSMSNTWKIINQILHKTGNNTPPSNIFNVGNNIVQNPQEIADGLNNYFINIGQHLASQIPQPNVDPLHYINQDNFNSLFFKPISDDELLQCINKLPKKKSSGHDELCASTIQKIAPYILKPLRNIFNLSLITGIVPNELKIAKVIPIFKSGDKQS